jgi:hypothetical protein
MIRSVHRSPIPFVSVLSVLVVLAGVSNADAAGPPAGDAPASPPTSPVPAPPIAPAAGPTGEDASARFQRGLQLFDEGDYTLALVEFERAYQLAPNYRALYNIALVNMQLGRYADAVRTLEQYVHDGGSGISTERRQEVTKSLAELKLRTATVDVSINVAAAEVTLDGKPIETASLEKPLLIDAGEHTLRATAIGFQPGYRTVTLAGADHVTVRLELVSLTPAIPAMPPEERGRSVFWPGFVATGVLAAGAIASGVVTLVAKSHYDSLNNQVGSTQSQRSNAAHETNSAGLAADILTGLAVVTGGVSLYLSLRVDHAPKGASTGMSQEVVLSGAF